MAEAELLDLVAGPRMSDITVLLGAMLIVYGCSRLVSRWRA